MYHYAGKVISHIVSELSFNFCVLRRSLLDRKASMKLTMCSVPKIQLSGCSLYSKDGILIPRLLKGFIQNGAFKKQLIRVPTQVDFLARKFSQEIESPEIYFL